jgi:hypothetical protein
VNPVDWQTILEQVVASAPGVAILYRAFSKRINKVESAVHENREAIRRNQGSLARICRATDAPPANGDDTGRFGLPR